jgi:hypothetical protein
MPDALDRPMSHFESKAMQIRHNHIKEIYKLINEHYDDMPKRMRDDFYLYLHQIIAFFLHRRLNIDTSRLVPLSAIASVLGIELMILSVKESTNKDIMGTLDLEGDVPKITINALQSRVRKRAVFAYLLGYYFLRDDIQIKQTINRKVFSVHEHSRQLDINISEFAVALLLPKEVIINELRKEGSVHDFCRRLKIPLSLYSVWSNMHIRDKGR